jgi:hypothetical protein
MGQPAEPEDLPSFEHPAMVRRLTDPSATGDELWGDGDLGGMLCHQLDSLIWVDLVELGPAEALRAQELCARLVPPVRTFRELLCHREPDPELLRMIKLLGKGRQYSPTSALPRELSLFLYFTSVLVARYRCGIRISDLDDLQLLNTAQWLGQQTWVSVEMRATIDTAITDLRTR